MRSIVFTISPDGAVTPTAPQYAGVQGEHRAAAVRFELPEAMQGDGYCYRVEYVDGMGAFDTTALLPVEDGAVSAALPVAWTAAGGQAIVRLVISRFADGEEQQTCYTVDALVFFRSRAQGGCRMEQVTQRGLSELIDRTETAAAHAEETARELLEAKEQGEFQGEKGERGEQGSPGLPGEPGQDGAEGVQYTAFTNNDSGVYYLTISPEVTCQSWQDFRPGTAFLVEFRKPIRENGGLLIDFVGNPSGGVSLTYEGWTAERVLPAGWYLVLWDGTQCRIQSREGELAGSSGIIPYGEVTVNTELAYSSVNMQPALRYWGDGMTICLRLDADVYAGLSLMCANGDFHFAGNYAAGTHLMRVQGDQLVSLGRFPGAETEELSRQLEALREEMRLYDAALLTDTTSGTLLELTDSAAAPLRALTLFGKTTQDGVPTPDAPVPMVSAGDDGDIAVKIGISSSDESPQTFTLSTPNGLPGIPVASGGNYTDETGQQWICDEIDLARGVYVQRIKSLVLTGEEEYSVYVSFPDHYQFTVPFQVYADGAKKPNAVMCSHFRNDKSINAYYELVKDNVVLLVDANRIRFKVAGLNQDVEAFAAIIRQKYADGSPVTLIVALRVPIETPLSDEKITAYKALHTYKSNTTIQNDSGAGMRVAYVQDSNTVIRRMQAAIAALSVPQD